MSEPDEDRRGPGAPAEPGEVEILEIVGLEEAGPGASEATDEIEVSFGEAGPDQPDAAPPVGAAREEPSAEVAALRQRVLRIQADFENLKRRVDRERDDYYRHAAGDLVARLLPVLDNLERAFEAARRAPGSESLVEGLALVRQQLLYELRREGLRPVETEGRSFDPHLHEAVATRRDPELPAGAIVEELQRGYLFHERLLRPALVRVNVHGTGSEPGEGP